MKKIIIGIASAIVMLFPMEITTEIIPKETVADVEISTATTEEIIMQEINAKLEQRKSREDLLNWFVEYKELRERYDEYVPYSTIYDEAPESEIYIMQRCIETETYQKDFLSRCNVASVIFNRALSKQTTAEAVITAPKQFAYRRTKISETTKLALEYAYEFGDTTNGCMAFRSDICPDTWRKWTYQFTDEAGHNFYK